METKSGYDDKPGFFKVLLGDFSEQLLIPPAFNKFIYGTPLPHKIMLQTSKKWVWEVDLVEMDRKLFFKKGWDDFVKDNFLELGDFVVFNFVRRSMFRCTIFGRNACEKDVDVPVVSRKKPVDRSAGKEASVSKVAEKSRAGDNGINPTTANCKQPNVHVTGNDAGGPNVARPERAASGSKISRGDNEVKPSTGNCKQQEGLEKNVQKPSRHQIHLALRRAQQTFKSKYPYVSIVMRPSYLTGENRNSVNISFKFVEAHFNKEHNNVVLKLGGGKSWPMKYYFSQETKQARLNSGWVYFTVENNLAVGDICMFEMMNKTKNILRANIIRNASTATT